MMSAAEGKKLYSNNFNRLKKEHIAYLGKGGKAMQIIMSGYNCGLKSGTYVVLRLKSTISRVAGMYITPQPFPTILHGGSVHTALPAPATIR